MRSKNISFHGRTIWFGSLAGLLIEINRLFHDALTFPLFN